MSAVCTLVVIDKGRIGRDRAAVGLQQWFKRMKHSNSILHDELDPSPYTVSGWQFILFVLIATNHGKKCKVDILC